METSILTDHLLITLVAWIVGLTLGGGIGYLMASLAHHLMRSKPDAGRIIALIPWRAVIFMLILVVWSPLLAVRLGLGNSTGMVMAGLTISLVAWPMVMIRCLNDWFPPSLRASLISGARTLLILALFATLGVGFVGGSGAGFYLVQQMNLLEFGKLYQGISLLGIMALILDVILGIVEYRAGFGQPLTNDVKSQKAKTS